MAILPTNFETHTLTIVHRAVELFRARIRNHERGLKLKTRCNYECQALTQYLLNAGLTVREARELTLVVVL